MTIEQIYENAMQNWREKRGEWLTIPNRFVVYGHGFHATQIKEAWLARRMYRAHKASLRSQDCISYAQGVEDSTTLCRIGAEK